MTSRMASPIWARRNCDWLLAPSRTLLHTWEKNSVGSSSSVGSLKDKKRHLRIATSYVLLVVEILLRNFFHTSLLRRSASRCVFKHFRFVLAIPVHDAFKSHTSISSCVPLVPSWLHLRINLSLGLAFLQNFSWKSISCWSESQARYISHTSQHAFTIFSALVNRIGVLHMQCQFLSAVSTSSRQCTGITSWRWLWYPQSFWAFHYRLGRDQSEG